MTIYGMSICTLEWMGANTTWNLYQTPTGSQRVIPLHSGPRVIPQVGAHCGCFRQQWSDLLALWAVTTAHCSPSWSVCMRHTHTSLSIPASVLPSQAIHPKARRGIHAHSRMLRLNGAYVMWWRAQWLLEKQLARLRPAAGCLPVSSTQPPPHLHKVFYSHWMSWRGHGEARHWRVCVCVLWRGIVWRCFNILGER